MQILVVYILFFLISSSVLLNVFTLFISHGYRINKKQNYMYLYACNVLSLSKSFNYFRFLEKQCKIQKCLLKDLKNGLKLTFLVKLYFSQFVIHRFCKFRGINNQINEYFFLHTLCNSISRLEISIILKSYS